MNTVLENDENTPSNGDNGSTIISRLPMNLSTLFPECRQQQERVWQGSFTFVHACDPQLGLIEKHILKKDNPGWKVDLTHLKCAIKMINEIQPKPKFLVVGGDMVDTPPYVETLGIHSEQYKDLKDCFDTMLDPDIKAVFVCGNHDVGDMPTFTTMDVYRNEFGPEYFTFWHGGVKFTVLNSQYFKFPELLEMEFFQQMEFLQNTRDDGALHHVVFQHIPLCIESEDEIDISFLNINQPMRHEVLNAMRTTGVKHIFYGHTHRNGISQIGPIEHVMTAAVGGTFDDTKSGFRVVYVSEKEITHEYIPLEVQFKEVNITADEDIQTTDESLLKKLSELERK